ncbi:MAG TPA: sigma-70 family RNA polymerase sigma factor [Anaeromyxobacter sp.]|nr:sigma-70 family RNA polymerase sigma factor [Anaeromyxobacter sp.]
MFDAPYSLDVVEPEPSSTPRSLSDGGLAARISADPGRDRAAEGEVCRRFAPRIRLYGLRHLRDDTAAADLVQEVLLVVLDRLRSGALREPDRLASFVLGACRLAVSDRRRGASRREALLARYGPDLAVGEAERPRLDVDRLDRCLEGLPPRERAVLQLTFYADRSSDQIAGELETTPGNVRVVRHRGLLHLRACMGVEEVSS